MTTPRSSRSRRPARPAGCIRKRYISELASVEFSCSGEDHSFGGHVETDGQCFCCEKHFDEAFSEENLDDLFEDWKESTVINFDSTTQQGKEVCDLR